MRSSLSSGGVATLRRKSKLLAACIQDESTLLASPVQATVLPRIGPLCSSKVITSAITWHGCESRVRPLITGTVAWRRQLDQRVVAQDADHDRVDIAREHARGIGDASRRGRAASPVPVSITTSPPSWRIATSNDTRVRVEGLSKIIASVLPASGLFGRGAVALERWSFMARLASIIPRSSATGISVRSRKCRGAERSPDGSLLRGLRGAHEPRAGAIEHAHRVADLRRR